MSNPLAIAAVTATLRDLIHNSFAGDTDLAGAQVTTQPPDVASNAADRVLNVFLYHAVPNAAWRNIPYPEQNRVPGARLFSPLALTLHYLITVYDTGNDDLICQRMLGYAMRALHEHPILDNSMIASALKNNDLHEQVERVRVTHRPVTIDEMSKIWSSLQTEYRMSVVYEASVVLIEMESTVPTALPVLERSAGDTGPEVIANLAPTIPTLHELQPPNGRPAMNIGDMLVTRWLALPVGAVELRFEHQRYNRSFTLAGILDETARETHSRLGIIDAVDVDISGIDEPSGLYLVTGLYLDDGGATRETNSLPVVLAPHIDNDTGVPLNATVAGGSWSVDVRVTPSVIPAQNVSLVIASLELPAPAHPATTDTLTFTGSGIASGTYPVRVRVDGVDSLVIADYTQLPPAFDPTQKVLIP